MRVLSLHCGSETLQLSIDLHVHTRCSVDSLITFEELVFYSEKRGLDGVAVTDHDRLDCALKMARETDFLIVPGIEVSSLNGHIIGLNVQEEVPKNLSVGETVDRIHDAGGVAIACHPATFFKGSLGKLVNPKFDAVEVINSSAIPFGCSVKGAERLASNLGLARVAGSDAHYGPEIGLAYTVVDAESDAAEIAKAIEKGLCQPFGSAVPFTVRLKREALVTKQKLQDLV